MTAFKSAVKNRTYNADNQLINLGFVYDGNGSPTTYNTKVLGYDPEQRMTSFGTTQTDAYNGDGLRAWKQKGALSTRTYYLYDGSTPVCEFNSTGALTATNTFAGGGLVSRRVGSTTTYYAFDERGNVAQRMSAAGAVTSSDLYDGYGARTSTVAVQPDPFGYGGQFGYYTDVETGLILCTHRYYDPAAGRFVTRDPIGYAGGVNLYGYTGNNPGSLVDPDGTASRPCYEIAQDIWNVIQEIDEHIQARSNDTHRLFRAPHNERQFGLNGENFGSWDGHAKELKQFKRHLGRLWDEFNDGPCSGDGLRAAVRRARDVPIPSQPNYIKNFQPHDIPMTDETGYLVPIFMGGAGLKAAEEGVALLEGWIAKGLSGAGRLVPAH